MNQFKKDLQVILDDGDVIEIFRRRIKEIEELTKKQREEKNEFRWQTITNELEKRKKEYRILDSIVYEVL